MGGNLKKLFFIAASAMSSLVSNAQSVREEWGNFLHPTFSELSSIVGTQDLAAGELTTRTLAITSVAFNRGGIIEANAAYYITRNCFYGCDLTLRPTSYLKVKAGIQKLPYLVEANSSLARHPFFGFSQQVSYLGGYKDLTGLSTRGRDFGVSLEGTFFPKGSYHVLDVIAGIYNGAGLQFKDVDDKKDFSGRIVFQPLSSLKLSAGALVGYYTPVEEELLSVGPLSKQRYSAGFQFEKKGWFVKAEDVYGVTDRLRSNGFAAYGGKALNENNTLAVVYDRFQRELGASESVSTKFGTGWSHDFGAGFTSKFQYEHTSYADAVTPSKNSLTLCLMFSFSAHL